MSTLTIESNTPCRALTTATPAREIANTTPDRTISLLGVFAVFYANIAGEIAAESSLAGAVGCFDVVYVASSMGASASVEGTLGIQEAVYFGWESGDDMAWEDGGTIVTWEIA